MTHLSQMNCGPHKTAHSVLVSVSAQYGTSKLYKWNRVQNGITAHLSPSEVHIKYPRNYPKSTIYPSPAVRAPIKSNFAPLHPRSFID